MSKHHKLKYIAVDACVMMRRNPQFLKPEVMDALRHSIQIDGFVVPILVSPMGERYKILSGNHRWMAAREVGLTELPAIIADLAPAQGARLAVNLNTVHGDPPIDMLVPFLAEMDDATLNTVHIEAAVKRQLILFDAALETRLAAMEIPESANHKSKPGTIPTCKCPTCGKRHSPPRAN